MSTRSSLQRATIFAATLVALAGAARAADADFCGTPTATPQALQATVSKADGVKEIFRNKEFVAYQDGNSQTLYTFTEPAEQSHPAAVCRKPVKTGDDLTLEMAIVCQGKAEECQRLEADFKLLNAKMEADIRNQASAASK